MCVVGVLFCVGSLVVVNAVTANNPNVCSSQGYNGARGPGVPAAWWAKAIMYILLLFPAFDVISAFPLVGAMIVVVLLLCVALSWAAVDACYFALV